MTALQRSYLTVEESDAVIASLLASTDRRRTAWEALSDADCQVLLRKASADLDACNWRGRPYDSEQDLAWPRTENGLTVGGKAGTSPPVPDGAGFAVWSVASVPWEILAACALQAAAGAVKALGLSDADDIDGDAQRGVSARSSPGGEVSIDLARAGSARARLDPDAYAACESLIAWGGTLA